MFSTCTCTYSLGACTSRFSAYTCRLSACIHSLSACTFRFSACTCRQLHVLQTQFTKCKLVGGEPEEIRKWSRAVFLGGSRRGLWRRESVEQLSARWKTEVFQKVSVVWRSRRMYVKQETLGSNPSGASTFNLAEKLINSPCGWLPGRT
jgi:hypothetical protein